MGSQTATVESMNHTVIVFVLPSGEGAGLSVSVNVAGDASNQILFSYSAPIVSSISPAVGGTLGSTSVTITGSNFGTSAAVTVFIFVFFLHAY